MNEQEKNIETCLAENILAEVASVPQDPQFRSLVNESLDPLKQQAAAQTGWDAYEKVVWSHWPYTFTSSVRQMKSNLILLLRRLWRFPFGRGTIRSFADMWQHYITRLQGNPEYGIPSRLSSLTDLPDAPALLADRKIGGADTIDGISLVHLLCTAYGDVTELTDDNIWNAGTKTDYSDVFALFPNLQKLTIGCEVMDGAWYKVIANKSSLIEFHAPNLRIFGGVPGGTWAEMWLIKGCSMTKLEFPALEEVHTSATSGNFITNNSTITEIYAPKLRDIRACSDNWAYRQYAYTSRFIQYCTALKKLVTNIEQMSSISDSYQKPLVGTTALEYIKLGTLKSWNALFLCTDTDGSHTTLPKLLHFEIGEGTAISLDFKYWNPDSETLAHQDFLPNFRDYIAERLTDQGSGKTLTLSQAVFSAVIEGSSPICDDIKGIIEDKGWKVQDTNNNIFPT